MRRQEDREIVESKVGHGGVGRIRVWDWWGLLMVMTELGGSGFEIDRVDQLGHGEVERVYL